MLKEVVLKESSPVESLIKSRGTVMQLVGLMGKIGSGKTTVAQILVNNFGFIKVSFADPLKQMLVNAKILTYDEAFVNKTPYAREMLQKIGTNLIRNQIDKDFWVKKTEYLINKLCEKGAEKIVIDDVRFPNEWDFIKRMGGIIIKIVDIENSNNNDHESESYVDMLPFDYLIENDKRQGIETLKEKVEKIIFSKEKVFVR